MKNPVRKIQGGTIIMLVVVLFLFLFIINFRERYAIKMIVDEENKRYLATLLAEEFRALSSDLTRYARAYCATEKQAYYDKYIDSLKWSRGEIERPNYLSGAISSRFDRKRISHCEILRAIGLSEDEKMLFLHAEELSDILVKYEVQAMDSVRLGQIVSGPLAPIEGETVQQFVARELYGEAYQKYLDDIAANMTKFFGQYQLQSDVQFKDYQSIFSSGLIIQFLTQVVIIAAIIILFRRLVIRMGQQKEDAINAKKEAEQQMIASEESANRMRQIMDSIPVGVVIHDDKLNFKECNQTEASMFGVKNLAEYKKYFRTSLIPPFQANGRESFEDALDHVQVAYKTGYTKFEWIHQHLDGTQIPVEITMKLVKFGDEHLIVSCTRDLREEKALKKEADDAQQRLSVMLDAIPIGVSIFDKDFHCFGCNQTQCNMMKIACFEEYRNKFYDFSPEYQPNGRLSKEYAHEHTSEAYEKGFKRFEWMHQRSDGTLIPTEITITCVQVGDEKLLVSSCRDLTEEKTLQTEVEHANERIRLMFDSTPICCTLRDPETGLIDCNQEALRLFGMSNKDEFITNCAQIMPKFQPQGQLSKVFLQKKINEVLQSGRVVFECMAKNKQDDEIPVEVTFISQILNEKPVIAGYVRDLRERKQLEKSEALSEIKMKFLANMSHEIRTPMNAIVGMSGILMSELLTPKQQNYVADIKRSADTLLTIINDLLDFSKLEAGKMELVPKHYNFHELLDNVTSTLWFIAQNKGLTLELHKVGDVPEFLYGDDVRLKQILWNLLGNALKFTKKGGATLTITDRGDQLRFDITDTGIGIKEDDLPQLFDAFMQVDKQNTAHAQGTGLGLSICKSIVELMGGTISVSSVYGEGTTFTFVMPKQIGDPKKIKISDAVQALTIDFSVKILVVDDNEINLNVASGIFNLLGVEIDTALSGHDAIRMVRKNDYDIVFMDHMMPEMDGIETTKQIRLLGEQFETLPIVALTANAVQGAEEMFLASGMNAFVSKPIDTNELNRVLIELLPEEKYTFETSQKLVGAEQFDESAATLKAKLVEKIPDLNVQLGLVRTGGNWKTYISSLKMLGRKAAVHIEKLERYLGDTDVNSYAIEIHGIKGALLGMGYESLAAEAAKLEREAKEGDFVVCQKRTPAFIGELRQLGSDLTEIFTEIEKGCEVQKKQGNPEHFEFMVSKIRSALDAFEGEMAMEGIAELSEYEYGESINENLSRLKELIEEYDFENAMLQLNHMQAGK
ncbi:MAG: ATP-binding protein [Thermoguttaceae bacterium]